MSNEMNNTMLTPASENTAPIDIDMDMDANDAAIAEAAAEAIAAPVVEEIEVKPKTVPEPVAEIVPEASEPANKTAAEAPAPAAKATRHAPASDITLSTTIIDDGNDMVDDQMPFAIQQAEIARMERDIQRKAICYAAVLGFEERNGNQVVMVLKRDSIRIVIPAEDFFAYSQMKDFDKSNEQEKFIRYRRKASHTFKGVVSFIPLSLGYNEDGIPFVVASRKQAMEKLQDRHFFGRNADVRVGSVAKASIISSGPRYVTVECLGVESVIGSGALSAFKYIDDVSEEFKAGMGLMVAVESLDVDKENRKINSISFSRALIERHQAKVETVSERMINGRYNATVVGSGNNFYFVIIDGLKIRGIVPKTAVRGIDVLLNGDSVAFLVTGINKERNILIGHCIKTSG